MFEIKRGQKAVNGRIVTTFKREVVNANILEVEAGTTGLCGGDTGHGCRTYFRIQDMGSTDINVEPIIDNYGMVEGFIVELGGDAELLTIIEALEFVVTVLKDETEV